MHTTVEIVCVRARDAGEQLPLADRACGQSRWLRNCRRSKGASTRAAFPVDGPVYVVQHLVRPPFLPGRCSHWLHSLPVAQVPAARSARLFLFPSRALVLPVSLFAYARRE